MSAVAFRLRSTFARRWPAVVMLVIVIGLVSGIVLACAAGARRTSTAPARYTASAGGDFDAIVTQQDGGAPATAAVRALDAVESAASITFVFGGLSRAGSDPANGPLDALVFAGNYRANFSRLIDGRDVDPGVAGEFVASRAFADVAGASIGDVFHLITLTQQEADESGFDNPTPGGPQLDAVLVGIVDGASQMEEPTPIAVMSPALLDLPELGVSQTLMSVRLRDGMSQADLRRELDTLSERHSLAVGPGAIISADIRRAVRTQAIGMWILTAVAGAAALVVLGQLVTRFAQVADDERERLRQIGFTDRMVLAESFGRALVPIVLGAIVAIGAAIVPSAVFPTGFARRLEPHPGAHVDLLALIGGAVAVVIALAAWSSVALIAARRSRRPALRGSSVERLAARSPSAIAATGLRFAFGRRSGGRAPSSGLAVAVAVTMALLVAAFQFGSSLQRLIDEPFRYGVNHDLALGDDGSRTLAPDLVREVTDDPDVASLVLYASDHARHGTLDVQLLGMHVLRGDGTPTLISGRLPSAPDEIVLGSNTARDLDASVGGSVELDGASDSVSLRVTGIAVIPGFGANEGVGSGGLLTMEGLLALNAEAVPNVIAVSFDDAAQGAAARLLDRVGAAPGDPFRPAVIINVARVRDVPYVLAALIGTLCLLTVVNVVVGSVTTRRREYAILQSLGAGGRWIGAVVRWQTTLLSLVPAGIGALVGIALGRRLFAEFADRMGAVDSTLVPVGAIVAALAMLTVIANIVTTLPARSLRRMMPARRLRAE